MIAPTIPMIAQFLIFLLKYKWETPVHLYIKNKREECASVISEVYAPEKV